MTAESTLQITCQNCKNQWPEDVKVLEAQRRVLYRDKDQTQRYRVRCPKCHTNFIITINMPEEG